MLLSVPVFAVIYAIVHTLGDVRLKKRGMPSDVEYYMAAPENMAEESRDEEPDI